MKRAIVLALSVILALVVAAPIASGQSSSQGKNLGKGQNLGKLTGDWWNWAVSTNPSPVNEGDADAQAAQDGNVEQIGHPPRIVEIVNRAAAAERRSLRL